MAPSQADDPTAQQSEVTDEQLRALRFAHAPGGMAIVSPAGRILAANPTWGEMPGYAPTELFKHPLADLASNLPLTAGDGAGGPVDGELRHRTGRRVPATFQAAWHGDAAHLRDTHLLPAAHPPFSTTHPEPVEGSTTAAVAQPVKRRRAFSQRTYIRNSGQFVDGPGGRSLVEDSSGCHPKGEVGLHPPDRANGFPRPWLTACSPFPVPRSPPPCRFPEKTVKSLRDSPPQNPYDRIRWIPASHHVC